MRQQFEIGILTPKQFEVAQMIAKGMTNEEIAKCMYVGERTIESHLYTMFAKFNINSRLALVLQLMQGVMVRDSLKGDPYFFQFMSGKTPPKKCSAKVQSLDIATRLRNQIIDAWWIPSKSSLLKTIDDLIAIISQEFD